MRKRFWKTRSPKSGSERTRRVCVRLITRRGTEVGHRFEPVRVGRDPGYRTVIGGPSAALLRRVTVCPKHYDRINRRTRQGPGESWPDPLYTLARLGDKLYGLYSRGVMQLDIRMLDDKPPEVAVYVVVHEFLHWVIERDEGSAASTQLDMIHDEPLRCLNYNTLRTWHLNRFREQYRPTSS